MRFNKTALQLLRKPQQIASTTQVKSPEDTSAELAHVGALFNAQVKPGLVLRQKKKATQIKPQDGHIEDPMEVDTNDSDVARDKADDDDGYKDDDDADFWELVKSEDDKMPRSEWQVELNGGIYPISDYLGPSMDKIIWDVHKSAPIEQPFFLATDLMPHQLTGVAKGMKLWNGIVGGGIWGDHMGLGKTLSIAVTCMLMKDQTPGDFCLVVTSRASAQQWLKELNDHFKPGFRPRAIFLTDPNVSLSELLSQRYDFVIVTYQFARMRHSALTNFGLFHQIAKKIGFDRAMEKIPKPERPWKDNARITASLHSEAYDIMDFSIKCLILDEAHQYAKRVSSQTHKALMALRYERCFVLTGTPIPDKWYDTFGLIHFLPRAHPFSTPAAFWKAFGSHVDGKRRNRPPASKSQRLKKFLLAITIARPASVLNIPNYEKHEVDFALSHRESTLDIYWTIKFLFALRLRGEEDVKDIDKGGKNGKALALSIRAQQYCACPAIVPEEAQKLEDKILQNAANLQELFLNEVRALSKVAPKDAADAANEPVTDSAPDTLFNSGSTNEMDSPDDLRAGDVELLVEQLKDKEALLKFLRTAKSKMCPPHKKKQQKDVNDSVVGGGHVVEDDEVTDFIEQTVKKVEDDMLEETLTTPPPRARKDFLVELKSWKDTQIFSSKIQRTLMLLDEIEAAYSGEKVIVFTKFLIWHDVLAFAMKKRGMVPPLRFDGSMNDQERAKHRTMFDDAKSGRRVILVTSGSGGAAINLAAASHVVLPEQWWCVPDIRQAISRAHRKGQLKTVHVWVLKPVNSLIEPVIGAIAYGKAEISDEFDEAVRRADDEDPCIPDISRGGVGEH